MKFFIFFIFLFHITALIADELSNPLSSSLSGPLPDPLPNPLKLQQALSLAEDTQYFQIIEAQAAIQDAQTEVEMAESNLGFRAQLEIEAAYIEPSRIALDQSNNDSSIALRLIKPLYDFGGSYDEIQAANMDQAAIQDFMPFIIEQRKIDIARQFYAVLLSDLKYAWDNEAMAVEFVRFDAAKDRYQLSVISDVDYLQSETRYLNSLHVRSLSEMDQRHSRLLLANLMGRPEQLPANLVMPESNFAQKKLPEYAALLEEILSRNPQIKLAEKKLQASQQRIHAASNTFAPKLNAEIEVAEYARLAGSHDEWRAQLNLIIPLYENRDIKRKASSARAAMLKHRANLLNIKMKVRKEILGLYQIIKILKQRHQQLQISQEFRELNLDKNRSLYEMEVKTNLGRSMVAITENRYLQAKNDFSLALAWMQLEHLGLFN